jgi:hypothetical protein
MERFEKSLPNEYSANSALNAFAIYACKVIANFADDEQEILNIFTRLYSQMALTVSSMRADMMSSERTLN